MSAPFRVKIGADDSPNQEADASAKPPVVRTLKDPPEIWDLVHETPAHFNATGAFVARLTSRKSNLILATLGLIFLSGLAVFVFLTLRDGRLRDTAAAEAGDDVGTNSAVQASREDALESSQDARVPGNASVVDNTSLPPTSAPVTDSQPTTTQPATPTSDNAAFAPNDSPQSTNMSEAPVQANGPVVSNVSKRTASRASRAAWAGTKRVTIGSNAQNADQPTDYRGASATIRPDTVAKPRTSPARHPLDPTERHEKNSSGAPSADKGSIPALSPQLIAPSTTTSAPKAKVIQWP